MWKGNTFTPECDLTGTGPHQLQIFPKDVLGTLVKDTLLHIYISILRQKPYCTIHMDLHQAFFTYACWRCFILMHVNQPHLKK